MSEIHRATGSILMLVMESMKKTLTSLKFFTVTFKSYELTMSEMQREIGETIFHVIC